MRRRIIAALATTILGVAIGGVAHAATTIATHEGETFTGTGAIVRTTDPTASGGQYLFQDSSLTVSKTVVLSADTDRMRVRLHGNGSLQYQVYVDGTAVGQYTETSTTWVERTYDGWWTAGSHTFGFKPINVATQNLYLDKVIFESNVAAVDPSETRMQAYVSGYSYWDNTPPGSAAISHPQIHSVAAGVGTYADPITVAVGHNLSSGSDVLDWPAGTKFYMPYLQRYFIVEDTCGDGPTPELGACHTGYPVGTVTWLDVWVGGGSVSEATSDACMFAITDPHTVIKNPPSTYRVKSGEVTANCKMYGEAALTS